MDKRSSKKYALAAAFFALLLLPRSAITKFQKLMKDYTDTFTM